MRARADLRRRLASVVILTVAMGIVGAVAITAFTAARRSDTAYARYRAAVHEPEVLTAGCDSGLFPPLNVDQVTQLPMVASADRFMLVNPVGAYLSDKVSPQDIFSGEKPPPGAFEKMVPLTVTGIVLTPNDLTGTDSTVLTTYPFYEAHRNTAFGCDAAALHLTRGLDDIPAFGAAISEIQPNAFFFDMTQESIVAGRST